MKRSFLQFWILALAMSFSTLLMGQKGAELGGWLGTSFYFGDLNTSYSLRDLRPAAGIIGRYNFNTRLALKFSVNYGSIRAADANSSNPFERSRNLSFRSNILDGSFQFEFNFFSYVHGSRDNWYTPYVFMGPSFFHFKPKAKYEGRWVDLQELGTEGQFRGEEYESIQPAINYGIGFKMDLNYAWSLNFELSGRFLYTDYLDDVSTTYPNMIELRNIRGQVGELAVALSDRSGEVVDLPIGEEGRQRGNSKNNDSYNFFSVGLVYYIGALECPGISREPQKKDRY